MNLIEFYAIWIQDKVAIDFLHFRSAILFGLTWGIEDNRTHRSSQSGDLTERRSSSSFEDKVELL